MGMQEKIKDGEEQKKFKVFGSVHPKITTFQAMKMDRFKRETVAQKYLNDLSNSLTNLTNLKNQLAQDVEVVISSLQLKKDVSRQEYSKLEELEVRKLQEQKEKERSKYTSMFKENYFRMKEEYLKQKKSLENEKQQRINEIREWFELKAYALDPKNHPKFYLTEISRSIGIELNNSFNFERDISEMKRSMTDEMAKINNERKLKEKAIEAQFSDQIKILEDKYMSLVKKTIDKECEIIKKLNENYAEKEAILKNEISTKLSIKLSSIDKLIHAVRLKHNRALHNIVRQEADLENEYRDNMVKLADPKQSIPENLASKYLYCPLKLKEAPKNNVAQKTEISSETNESVCKMKENVSKTDGMPKSKQKVSGIIKTAVYSLALGGLIYFYPDLAQKKISDGISKSVSDVYVHSKTNVVVVSHEAMKRASKFRLSQKQNMNAKNVKKKEYAPVQIPNSPLLETALGLKAKEEVHKKLVKSGLILNLSGFLESVNDVDSKFLKKKEFLASRLSESSGNNLLKFGKKERKLLEFIIKELDQGDFSFSKKEKLLTVLKTLNESNFNKNSLKSALNSIRKIKKLDDNVSDFEAWLSMTSQVHNSPLIPDGYARPVAVQIQDIPAVASELSVPKVENSSIENTKEVQPKMEIEKKNEIEEKIEDEKLPVQTVESDVNEAFEQVKTMVQEVPVQPQTEKKTKAAPEIQPEGVSEFSEVSKNAHDNVQSSKNEIKFGYEPIPSGKERTIIMCGNRPVYIEHDVGVTFEDNDPDLCDN